MSDTAIRAEGISKMYKIGIRRDPYGRLTESLWNAMSGPFRRDKEARHASDFWALRDVSFEVPRGSAVGIIGRNGAGKSTLLKILSRITEPTLGRAELHGRVGSLLEVGTGFHQELTGRENIMLSGAILGMKRTEILGNFDQIVDFAEIGAFLDTPVKRYSSGMKVRLGFAVAAFLEPEILFVDEVLAVGDAQFQKKCLGKMSEIGEGGRTVLFVSHSMPAILRLCNRAILLDHGRVVTDGLTSEVVHHYLQSNMGKASERTWDAEDMPGNDVARLKSVRVLSPDGQSPEELDIRRPVQIEITYVTNPRHMKPTATLHLYNDEGVMIFTSGDTMNRDWTRKSRSAAVVTSTMTIPGNFLAEGRFIVTVAVSTLKPQQIHAIERDAVSFQVVDRSEGDGVRGEWASEWPGVVRPMLDWQVQARPIKPSDGWKG